MNVIKLSTLMLCTFMPSPIRLAIWRLLGFKVGRGCHVAMFSIVVADTIELGHGAVIEPLTLVYKPSFFTMGQQSRIAGFVRIIGYGGKVVLGEQSFIALGCLIDISADFELGNRSQIGPRSMIYTHGGSNLIFNMRYPFRIGPVKIGTDCWICMGCMIYPNVVIGSEVVLLPGSIVHHNLSDGIMIVPSSNNYKIIPTKLLQNSVTRDSQQKVMQDLLRDFAKGHKKAKLDDSSTNTWSLFLPDYGTIYLILVEDIEVFQCPPSTDNIVIWTLNEQKNIKNITQFCFSELSVFGKWTQFVKMNTQFLNKTGGIPFIFKFTTSVTHNEN